jgi:membrane protease YdiL (CAAX protease family)
MQFWIAAGVGISCYAITSTLLQMARIGHFLVAGQSYAIPANIFIMGDAALANALVATLLAPLLEELVFRKWLISGLIKLRIGTVLALTLSSAIFVLAHSNPSDIGPVDAGMLLLTRFILGIAMGVLYLGSRNLLLPIVAHMIHNMLVLLPKAAVFYPSFPLSAQQAALYLGAYAMILLLGLGGLASATRRLRQCATSP